MSKRKGDSNGVVVGGVVDGRVASKSNSSMPTKSSTSTSTSIPTEEFTIAEHPPMMDRKSRPFVVLNNKSWKASTVSPSVPTTTISSSSSKVGTSSSSSSNSSVKKNKKGVSVGTSSNTGPSTPSFWKMNEVLALSNDEASVVNAFTSLVNADVNLDDEKVDACRLMQEYFCEAERNSLDDDDDDFISPDNDDDDDDLEQDDDDDEEPQLQVDISSVVNQLNNNITSNASSSAISTTSAINNGKHCECEYCQGFDKIESSKIKINLPSPLAVMSSITRSDLPLGLDMNFGSSTPSLESKLELIDFSQSKTFDEVSSTMMGLSENIEDLKLAGASRAEILKYLLPYNFKLHDNKIVMGKTSPNATKSTATDSLSSNQTEIVLVDEPSSNTDVLNLTNIDSDVLLSSNSKSGALILDQMQKRQYDDVLLVAAASGHIEMMKLMLASGKVKIDKPGVKELNPLMEASTGGHHSCVQCLIKFGANVNAKTKQGNTALMYACAMGNLEIVAELVKAGANIEAQNDNGHTALMEAASAGHVDVAQFLVSKGCNISVYSTEYKETALTLASYKGHYEMVKYLISVGPPASEREEEMHTALMEASMDGHVNVARLLIDSGAQVNMPPESYESPLTLAACGGHVELAWLLINRGANLEEMNDEGYTALMEAAREGHEETVCLLLNSGAQVNVVGDENKETALFMAASAGYLEVVDLLLGAGADTEKGNSTPLIEASQEGHLDIVNSLIKAGADVNATNLGKHTPLHVAAENGHVQIVQTLLANGAVVDAIDEGGITALMKAALSGHLYVVEAIVEAKANVNLTANGMTALGYACMKGHELVVDSLLQHGGDPFMPIKDSLGNESNLMVETSKAGSLNIMKMLVDYAHDQQSRSQGNSLKNGQSATNNSSAKTGSGTTTITPVKQQPSSKPSMVIASAPVPASVGDSIPYIRVQDQDDPDAVVYYFNNIIERNDKMVRSIFGNFFENFIFNSPDMFEESKKKSDSVSGKNSKATNGDASKKKKATATTTAVEEKSSNEYETLIPGLWLQKHLQNDESDHLCKLLNTLVEVSETSCQTDPVGLDDSMSKLHLELEDASDSCELSSSVKELLYQQVKRLNPLQCIYSIKNGAIHRVGYLEDTVFELFKELSTYYCLPKGERSIAPVLSAVKALDCKNGELLLKPAAKSAVDKLNNFLSNELVKSILQCKEIYGSPVTPDEEISDEAVEPCEDFTYEEDQQQQQSKEDETNNCQMSNEKDESQINHVDSSVKPIDSNESESGPEVVQELRQKLELHKAKSYEDLWNKLLACSDVDREKLEKEFPEILRDPKFTDTLAKYSKSFLTEPNYDPFHTVTRNHEARSSFKKKIKTALKGCFDQTVLTGGISTFTTSTTTTVCAGSYQNPLPPTPKPLTDVELQKCRGKVQAKAVLSARIAASTEAARRTKSSAMPNNVMARVSRLDLDSSNSNSETALTVSASSGNEELVKFLVSRGARIEHREKKGFTPLMLASQKGHAGIVKFLLDSGANLEACSERTKDTSLNLACSAGHLDVVSHLLMKGANKEHRNVSDYTPLSLAAAGGYVDIINLLLSYGAEINSRTGSKLGISPLMLAAMNGHADTVRLLLERGGDINAFIETNKNTALTLACFQGRATVVQLLLDRSANIEHRAKTGLTPLMEAASGGFVEVGKVLIENGAEVNGSPVPASKDTALTIAADKGHLEFVKILIANNAAIDVKNKKGFSPLWLACNTGHLCVVKELVEAGCDVDSQDNRKVSCIMAACRKGHQEIVRYLLDHVTQFPSDLEVKRSVMMCSEELRDTVNLCSLALLKAKDQQEKEAARHAASLLEEIDQERNREEKRKAAAAKKKKKKEERKKAKKQESKPAEAATTNKNGSKKGGQKCEKNKAKEEEDEEEEEDETSVITGNDEEFETYDEIVVDDFEAPFVPADFEREKKSTKSSKKSSSSAAPSVVVAEKSRVPESHAKESSVSPSASATKIPSSTTPEPEAFVKHPRTTKRRSNVVSSLMQMADTSYSKTSVNSSKNGRFQKTSPVPPVTSTGGAAASTAPKREEGWREVSRRGKRVLVPSGAISRVIGRAGCNINTVRELSGANIEVEKQAPSQTDRMVLIRGSPEATRYASQLITSLANNAETELSEHVFELGFDAVPIMSASENATPSQSTCQYLERIFGHRICANAVKNLKNMSTALPNNVPISTLLSQPIPKSSTTTVSSSSSASACELSRPNSTDKENVVGNKSSPQQSVQTAPMKNSKTSNSSQSPTLSFNENKLSSPSPTRMMGQKQQASEQMNSLSNIGNFGGYSLSTDGLENTGTQSFGGWPTKSPSVNVASTGGSGDFFKQSTSSISPRMVAKSSVEVAVEDSKPNIFNRSYISPGSFSTASTSSFNSANTVPHNLLNQSAFNQIGPNVRSAPCTPPIANLPGRVGKFDSMNNSQLLNSSPVFNNNNETVNTGMRSAFPDPFETTVNKPDFPSQANIYGMAHDAPGKFGPSMSNFGLNGRASGDSHFTDSVGGSSNDFGFHRNRLLTSFSQSQNMAAVNLNHNNSLRLSIGSLLQPQQQQQQQQRKFHSDSLNGGPSELNNRMFPNQSFGSSTSNGFNSRNDDSGWGMNSQHHLRMRSSADDGFSNSFMMNSSGPGMMNQMPSMRMQHQQQMANQYHRSQMPNGGDALPHRFSLHSNESPLRNGAGVGGQLNFSENFLPPNVNFDAAAEDIQRNKQTLLGNVVPIGSERAKKQSVFSSDYEGISRLSLRPWDLAFGGQQPSTMGSKGFGGFDSNEYYDSFFSKPDKNDMGASSNDPQMTSIPSGHQQPQQSTWGNKFFEPQLSNFEISSQMNRQSFLNGNIDSDYYSSSSTSSVNKLNLAAQSQQQPPPPQPVVPQPNLYSQSKEWGWN